MYLIFVSHMPQYLIFLHFFVFFIFSVGFLMLDPGMYQFTKVMKGNLNKETVYILLGSRKNYQPGYTKYPEKKLIEFLVGITPKIQLKGVPFFSKNHR